MKLLDRLLTLLALDRLPRTGWLQAGVPLPESIAAHGLGTALIATLTADAVEPALDLDRCVTLCVVHDAPEALLGDLPLPASRLLPPGAKRSAELQAADQLLGPPDSGAGARFAEFVAGETREARFARACDKLHLGLRALGYRRAGLGDLDEFRGTMSAVDCSEFAPLAELQRELLQAFDSA